MNCPNALYESLISMQFSKRSHTFPAFLVAHSLKHLKKIIMINVHRYQHAKLMSPVSIVYFVTLMVFFGNKQYVFFIFVIFSKFFIQPLYYLKILSLKSLFLITLLLNYSLKYIHFDRRI